MNNLTRLYRFQFSRLLLALLTVLVTGCGDEDTTPTASPELLESGAESVIYQLAMEITVDGIREGRVEADTAFIFPDSAVYSLRNPTLILYQEGTGVERARVVSERGRFNLNTRELVARGDVVLTIPEGARQVETQELHYDPAGDQIWSDSTSVMREGGTVTRGQSFRSDLGFQRAEIINGSIIQQGEPGGPGPETGPPGRGPSRS